MEKRLPCTILENWPAYDVSAVHALFEKEYAGFNSKIVVLDDDPTGIQTVHDVSVYTSWNEDAVLEGFREADPMFFILTNSRSFAAAKTESVHCEIAQNVCQASTKTAKSFILLSRSDSTLRGHFPLETETLRKTIEAETGRKIDGEIIVPFFKEGGRYTIDDVHYVRQGKELVPAGQTEFAKDKTFGFFSSNLKQWCEEKTHGTVTAGSVTGIELADLRAVDVEKIERQLCGMTGFGKIIVNAIDYTDLEVFTIAFLRAVARGKQYIFRSAASLVKVLGNITDRPLLCRSDLLRSENKAGGIVIAGSHVHKTTVQLEQLKTMPDLEFIEFNQHRVLEVHGLEREVERTVRCVTQCIGKGKSVVIFTRRERIDFPGGDAEKNLALAVAISEAVTSIISELPCKPGFIVAKGGITSSDIGTKALKVRKARVMGQIQPGIPVWMTGPESRFPYLPYVIFPGNVGEPDTLKRVVQILVGQEK